MRFRLHTDEHAPPGSGRLLGLTLIAAVCVFVGLIPAVRLAASIAIDGPWWYPMLTVTLGVIGCGLIVAAFAAIHRALLPWYLVGVAVLLLAANVALVYVV
ncbi:hypothetical protein [Allorhizocola rhizosphaerae]|uniref:hypothetical protein n=1 Tax=Allorhizocola rhizosphaerae TaxID=1872709 RepID=UPI0013C2C57B|nr:hypothetical protein [Allorhizocola rhizosphaerae]